MKRMLLVSALAGTASAALAGAPQYTIIDMGLVQPGDFAAQGFGISPGGVAVGRSIGSPTQAFMHTAGGGLMGLPNDPTRDFGVANGANDSGAVVGTGSTTPFGSGPLPLIWNNGVVSQLPLHAGAGGAARANDINDDGVAVGSSNGGSLEFATYWSGGVANAITATTPGGASMTTAFRVNNDGMAVGNGIDPNALARNVPLVYDIDAGTLMEIPSLAGDNGGIAFDVSENGFVTGSSSFNQTGSNPFIWSSGTGTIEVPLPVGASQGSGRGVNSSGWVVGTGSGVFALPFLFDGTDTYLLQDLIPGGSGWDLSMNTSSSAFGIAEDGTIVGTGVFNGETRAYRMTLIPAPGAASILGVGALAFVRRRR